MVILLLSIRESQVRTKNTQIPIKSQCHFIQTEQYRMVEYQNDMQMETDYPSDSLEDAKEHIEKFEEEFSAISVFGNNVILNEPMQARYSFRYLKIHYIDVGQGDSVFIQSGGGNMLVDAGDNEHGTKVVEYLKSHGVSQLDLVIATHPHVDHIGGMDDVLKSISVKRILLPEVSYSSDSFQAFMEVAVSKQIPLLRPVIGDTYLLGNAKFTVIAPNSTGYEEVNDYSVGIRLDYGSHSFLFCGDAEETSEYEMCENGISLKADVLKLSHHGSKTSTTDRFLRAVDPTYAIISVEKGNEYGHPCKKLCKRLKKHNVKVIRTDESGSIIVASDGVRIYISTEK